MGISQYTFIKKERRAEWDRIPEQHRQEERLLLWQGDRGNAAAESDPWTKRQKTWN